MYPYNVYIYAMCTCAISSLQCNDCILEAWRHIYLCSTLNIPINHCGFLCRSSTPHIHSGVCVESIWIQIKCMHPYLQVKLSLCITNAWLDMSSHTQTQFMCKLSLRNSNHSTYMSQISFTVHNFPPTCKVQKLQQNKSCNDLNKKPSPNIPPNTTIDRNIEQIDNHLRLTASISHISTFKSTQKANLQNKTLGRGTLVEHRL